MASAAGLSAPGTVTYDSNTMSVGDGTWDFTKNTFLLPNLLGPNFETLRYNGMGNRFSSVSQYQTMILAHGLLGAAVFLFLVPFAVIKARFSPSPNARRHHAYAQVLGILLITVVFILGWFAVGPARSWTNPHHVIGLTLYVLFLLQAVLGRLFKNIYKRSLRLMFHRWIGRCTALLGIAQIPLGLALYGSPIYTFILYAIWMGFLVVVWFVLSWRHDGHHHDGALLDARRHEHEGTEISQKKSGHGWLGPLAAGAGIFALMKSRKRSGSHSSGSSVTRTTRSRSTRHPEVIPSRRGSASYFSDEKYSDVTGHTKKKDGGMMGKLLGVAGALGAGALVKNYMDKREKRRYDDEEYSAVATETPGRNHPQTPSRYSRPADTYTESDFTEDRTQLNRPITPMLPGPGGPTAAAAAISAAERPSTPRPVRPPHARADSFYSSEYSSYVSPSRRTRLDESRVGGAAGKGFMAAVGLGWLANKFKGRREKRAEEERLRYEDERRDGRHGSRYTADGYSTPSRTSRRRPPPALAETATTFTQMTHTTESTEQSSMVEPLPPHAAPAGRVNAPHPAIPPAPAASALIPAAVPVPGSRRHSRSGSRRSESRTRPVTATTEQTVTTVPPAAPLAMPDMPADPQGLFAPLRSDAESEAYTSAGGRPSRTSSRRRREGEAAAAAAAASASQLAESERTTRQRSHSRAPSKPVSVKVKYHDDRDRNVTLRRLTDEEAAAARRERNRGRSNSMSSMGSDSEAPTSGRGRYRRTSSARRGREPAPEDLEPLSPPAPLFAKGKKKQKDSAYYSGQPGLSGEAPAAAQTVSSLGSHGTWSALSPSPSVPKTGGYRTDASHTDASVPASAADRRRRRRMERQGSRPPDAVDFS